MVRSEVDLVLLHFPVKNRRGEEVTSAVTNLDIHDIARSARTYDVRRYWIVTPIGEQRRLVARILEHWQTDQSRQAHPDRSEALSRVKLAACFEDVKHFLRDRFPDRPLEVVLTDARPLRGALSSIAYRSELAQASIPKSIVLVFGTAWGVSETFYPEVHRVLTPVYGPEGERGYNHLSVRAAVSVILDRLFGLEVAASCWDERT